MAKIPALQKLTHMCVSAICTTLCQHVNMQHWDLQTDIQPGSYVFRGFPEVVTVPTGGTLPVEAMHEKKEAHVYIICSSLKWC